MISGVGRRLLSSIEVLQQFQGGDILINENKIQEFQDFLIELDTIMKDSSKLDLTKLQAIYGKMLINLHLRLKQVEDKK